MRIVQTFWTAGRNPLEHSFGWLRPEYNLMSWTLSCLCLRKHYDEVALYTDEQGKRVLIDLLHLPYTEVNVVYDETLCLPQHWAYAKVKTYSLQTKPFLHIDGDIFLFKPLTEVVVNVPLITQSKEIGTKYYRQIMDEILRESVLKLPQLIVDGLKEESIASYNMGVFGGNDISFIRAYCKEALALCDTNKDRCSNGNFNLLFEQIFFALKARLEKQPVRTIFSGTFNDNGYTAKEFCQIDDYEHKNYFHFLGGHKREQCLIESLEEVLIFLYPNYYRLIINLFPHLLPRCFAKGAFCIPFMAVDIPIKSYIDFLNDVEEGWNSITWEELHQMEFLYRKGKVLSLREDKLRLETVVCLNPFQKSFNIPTFWDEEARRIIRERLSCKEDVPIHKVVVIPTLSSKLRKEYVLFELEEQVLETIRKHPMQVSDLLDELMSKDREKYMYTLWMMEIRMLLNKGLLIPNNNYNLFNNSLKT